MGQAACKIIIDGERAYAAIEDFADQNHQVNINSLEAAVRASCNIITYVSLYSTVENNYVLTPEVTQPIINLHHRIINELASVTKHQAQDLVDELAFELFAASDKIGILL